MKVTILWELSTSITNSKFYFDAVHLSYDKDKTTLDRDADRTRLQLLITKTPEHRKLLRFIDVVMRIEAPEYWWKQFATYKFADTYSTSVMHSIMDRELTKDDFEYIDNRTLKKLNELIKKNKFAEVVALLPMSYKRTALVHLDLETILNIIRQRKNHKLVEWRYFVDKVRDVFKTYMEMEV